MDDPVAEIPHVIHLLTQSPPSIQRATINKYFTPNASFTHPFVRTGSWSHSRVLIHCVYRWYKIMSPRIEISVQSVAFDAQNQILYVQISQVFRIWWIPFYYAPVHLTAVLKLTSSPSHSPSSPPSPSQHSPTTKTKYYIASQTDLYQTDQFVKFVAPGFWVVVWLLGGLACLGCVVGAVLGVPVTWVEEHWGWGEGVGVGVGEGRVEAWEKEKRGWEGEDGKSDAEVVKRSELRGRILG